MTMYKPMRRSSLIGPWGVGSIVPFPNDESLMKCLYLATQNITKKWTTRYPNWDMIYNELNILYP